LKAILLAAVALGILTGCIGPSQDNTPAPASYSNPTNPQIAILVHEVPGYGNCTFAYVYAGGGYQGGPALTLVGCKA
jgi:hypothetical protein